MERATTEYLKENSEIMFSTDTAEQVQEEMEEKQNEDFDFFNHSFNKSPERPVEYHPETKSRFKVKSTDPSSSKYSLPVQPIQAPSEFRLQSIVEEEGEVEYLLDSSSSSSDDDQEELTYPIKRKAENPPEKKLVPKKPKLLEIIEPSSSTTTPVPVLSVPVVTQIQPQSTPQPNYSPILPSCDCTTDPDAIFLRSLLEDMKTMSRKNKGLFKIKVQQLLQDILYPDD